ncbi:putative HTH-type transcriptional regulator YttP [Sporomusa ovata DSM 2662]|uniref:Transcriptional regulator, TetR family n=1 Tax=Sporomusa ovata TaxID=2378 RepID=A0A0U1L003_9FIRM|nr:TetR family transcriptional regulator [Sporomusa ovata]EQB27163.1 transcriptional regulator, TetR family [Sporomusa ovata DSM 2662]CQR72998.1 Transcriptional regulator, TetR family [Sporomusa ovata]
MNITKKEICTDKPTVNKLIEAAIPLFATKGLAAVSVKELADAAGVNIALISYYFGGKDKLYAFVLENQLAILRDAIDAISKEEISAVMKLRRFADLLIVTNKKNPYIDRLFFTEVFNPTKYFDSLVKSATRHSHFFLQGCIEEAKRNGEFRSDIDSDLAAMSLLKILNLSFTAQDLFKELMPSKQDIAAEYMSQALEIYLNGVAKHS